MTEERRERFIRAQLTGLAALGLDAEALVREEAMLRTLLERTALFTRLLEFSRNGG